MHAGKSSIHLQSCRSSLYQEFCPLLAQLPSIYERRGDCRYMQTSADHLRYSSEGSEGSDELREACRQGLRFAQQYNAWLEEASALQALLQAWQQLVAVAITKRCGSSFSGSMVRVPYHPRFFDLFLLSFSVFLARILVGELLSWGLVLMQVA